MNITVFNVTGCLEDCPFCSECAFCNFYGGSIWDNMGDGSKPTFCKVVKVTVEEKL